MLLYSSQCKKSCIVNFKGATFMKRPVMTIVLTCLLSMSVLAGDVHTPELPAPTPSGTPGIMALPGETPSALNGTVTSDVWQQATDAAFKALLSVLSIV
jgi:hypothetical protein